MQDELLTHDDIVIVVTVISQVKSSFVFCVISCYKLLWIAVGIRLGPNSIFSICCAFITQHAVQQAIRQMDKTRRLTTNPEHPDMSRCRTVCCTACCKTCYPASPPQIEVRPKLHYVKMKLWICWNYCRSFNVYLPYNLLQTFDLLSICRTACCTTNGQQIEVSGVWAYSASITATFTVPGGTSQLRSSSVHRHLPCATRALLRHEARQRTTRLKKYWISCGTTDYRRSDRCTTLIGGYITPISYRYSCARTT